MSGATEKIQEQHEILQATDRAALAASSEWQNSTSAFHLAGYGDAQYVDREGQGSEFNKVSFNPIFHFMYRDKVLWGSELEFGVDADGNTDVTLEYSAINWFFSDYAALVAGKFLSPLGQFRQNLHPSWINKLATAPPGFGHDGAAPSSDVGLQVRGGVGIAERSQLTYAAYVANGPELEAEDGELHAIESEGFTRDVDQLVVGGRVSFLPLPALEIGLSGATGEATVTVNDESEFEDDPHRGYKAYGLDFAYFWRGFEGRGEYIAQDIDDDPNSVAPEGGTWDAWYVQAAYQPGSAPWEFVARYSDFDSPQDSQKQKQWALGLNYLISPNAIVKLNYEINDGAKDSDNDADQWLAQFAYGY